MTRRRSGRRVVRQWAWLLAAMLAATTLATVYGFFWRADLAVYDAALPVKPAPEDVVIVAVDDASIAELGRWPWPRTIHAGLVARLAEAGARAIAFDILFVEPDLLQPQADEALAQAIARGPPTVLPLAVEMPAANRPLRVLRPIDPLAQVAAGLGHVHLELDRDGVGRSVFLREGPGEAIFPHLMLALLEHAPGERQPRLLAAARHPDLAGAGSVWVRDYQMLIPFRGPPGHFQRISYADVLSGRVEAKALQGKLVLVGLTAQGTGDAYPTPRSGEGVAMPGVEISANVLQALRGETLIRPLGTVSSAVIAMIPIVLVALGFLRLTPSQSLVMAGAVWLATLSASVLALRAGGYWWPPVASLAALLVMYPLWSWRRLEATQSYMDEELARLSLERFPFTLPAATVDKIPFSDDVERRLAIVRLAAQRSRDARRLFSDIIRALPGATILTDNQGHIVIANAAAARLFVVPDETALEGALLDLHLRDKAQDPAFAFAQLAARSPVALETVLHPVGRNVLVRTVPFSDAVGQRVGTIIEITDITELRAAQREREDVLRFLSHDMKSPASSLLGLAQLQRDAARALPPPQLAERLELLAQRLLTLVDGFVGLARAESIDQSAFEDFDLRDALQDAHDEVWAAAQARGITIDAITPEEAVLVRGDRSLLARAFINLLGNALKFSAPGSRVVFRCRGQGAEVLVEIEDSGPGIAEDSRASLFQRFSRRVHRGESDPGGAGLGLAFVRVVAEKHGGRVWMQDAPSGGAIFAVSLPSRGASALT